MCYLLVLSPSNFLGNYQNPQYFSDSFTNIKNVNMNTIGDLDDSHGDAEDSVNNKSITSMDINQLYQDVAPKIDFDALLKKKI